MILRRNRISSDLQFATRNDYGCMMQRQANVLIALHACDTATDDAIYKGIKANANLIVVAPCCHKQIRREIRTHTKRKIS
jgi:hypothetical protein